MGKAEADRDHLGDAGQYRASSRMVASCTPWDSSVTVSRSGHWVAARRRRKSTSASSGTLMRKGRIALSPSVALDCAGVVARGAAVAARPNVPAAAVRTRTLRRLGLDMLSM